MKLVVVCVRDVRANVYWNPMCTQSVGDAMRSFEDQINRAAEDNLMYKHPGDFELYHLGSFDSMSGRFELLNIPSQLTDGRSCVRKPQKLESAA